MSNISSPNSKNSKRKRKTKKTMNSSSIIRVPSPYSRLNTNRSYCDNYYANTSITTTQLGYHLESPTMTATTGQFATYPQVFKPTMAGTTSGLLDFIGRVRYRKLWARINLVGSQATTIAAGDLYNRVRLVLFWTQTNYTNSVTVNPITIDTLFDLRDTDILIFDQTYPLPSQAFDSATGYNVPQCICIQKSFELDIVHEVFSNAGGAIWDTRRGTFYMYLVSDSTVTPYPTFSGMTRLEYDIEDI
jgi:hypothetical protein